jgi:cytochrome P450
VTDGPVSYPLLREHALEPPPTLATLRRRAAVSEVRHADGSRGWLVTSYSLVRDVLTDPRFASSAPYRKWNPLVGRWTWDPGGNLIVLDGSEHTRLRRLHATYFSVQRINEMRPRLDQIVRACLDGMEAARGPVDLVRTFAFPVHSLAVCELLGLSPANREWFERSRPSTLRDSKLRARDGEQATQDYCEYLRGVIAEKRSCASDDVLGGLIRSGELTEDQLLIAATNMSGMTTANTIALAVLALLAQRDRWEVLVASPASRETALEELLRCVGAFQVIFRTALEEVELDGATIEKGEWVMLSLVAANHDPDRFANPDRLDLARHPSGHVAFGHGRHMCLGHYLARVELQTALSGLMSRFPTLRLAVPIDNIELYEPDIYAVKELPVEW